MTATDIKHMEAAIGGAGACRPRSPNIPKVGAIIAIGENVIGRGRRGSGNEGDDKHAELVALESVDDKTMLPRATLYTTLEPCTKEVRTRDLESCTELILQHKIKKVFIGILDPNQGVRGKGMGALQDGGVELELFPHDLARQIQAINADFVRCQQTLGATIVSPKPDEMLHTYNTGGRHPVCFKSVNPPTTDNYLLSFHGGSCWPSPGPFRPGKDGLWEIDAHFGSAGAHTLYLVTANDLGKVLIEYYRLVIRLNRERRDRLKAKFNSPDVLALLGGDYPGIQMNGLPKGLRLEASVGVTIAKKP